MSERRAVPCLACNGTGQDAIKTKIARKCESDPHMWVRCWNCHGNGLDPAELFRWGPHPPLECKL